MKKDRMKIVKTRETISNKMSDHFEIYFNWISKKYKREKWRNNFYKQKSVVCERTTEKRNGFVRSATSTEKRKEKSKS